MADHVIRIEGMKCDGCRANVENALKGVPGVEVVDVDLERRRAHVRGAVDGFSLENAVIKAGYQASLEK